MEWWKAPELVSDDVYYGLFFAGLIFSAEPTEDAIVPGSQLPITQAQLQTLSGIVTNSVLKDTVTFNALDHGVKGDGTTDDTAAWNLLLSAVPDGSRVFLPVATSIVSVDSNGFVLMIKKKNIELFGAGDASIIKLKNSAGDYVAMISDGTLLATTDMSGLRIHDLQIDQNCAHNPVSDASNVGPLFTGFPRLAVRVYKGFDGRVERVRFSNGDSINHIAINGGPSVVGRWTIKDCYFTNVGNGVKHDHSTIYFHGDNVLVEGNIFEGGGAAATTAIEIHGAKQITVNNRADAYGVLANITGVAVASYGVLISGNIGTNMGCGIQLWAYDYAGLVGAALVDTIVAHNQIEIDYDLWHSTFAAAYRFGVAINPGSTGVVQRVKIADNQITYKSYTDTPTATDDHSAGILVYRSVVPTNGTEDVGVEISRNTIVAPLSSGVHIINTINMTGWKIEGNRVLNPGNGATTSAYKVGVFFAAPGKTAKDCEISNNEFIDTYGTHKIATGVDTQFISTAVNCRAVDNVMRLADGVTSVPVHTGHASSPWYTRHAMGTYVQPVGVWQAGSSVVDMSTGKTYKQVTAPSGSSWADYSTTQAGADATRDSNITANAAAITANTALDLGKMTQRFRSGYYYAAPQVRGAFSNQVMVQNKVYYVPFFVGEATSFVKMGMTIATGQASTTIRVGIYQDNGHSAPSGAPLTEAATPLDSSAAASVETAISITLQPGLYWLAACSQGGTTQPTVAQTITPSPFVGGGTLAEGVTGQNCYATTGASGALPSYTESARVAFAPVVALKVA